MGNHQDKLPNHTYINNKYPDDIMHLVLLKVDILTLLKCSIVCRQFNRILSNPYFWECKLKTKRHYREVIRSLISTPERKKVTKLALMPIPDKQPNDSRQYVPCLPTSSSDSLSLALSLKLEVSWRTPDMFDHLYYCKYCKEFSIRLKNTHARCQRCGYVASDVEPWFLRITPESYVIWKLPSYRFPYD